MRGYDQELRAVLVAGFVFVGDGWLVVKYKSAVESIGINDDGQQTDGQNGPAMKCIKIIDVFVHMCDFSYLATKTPRHQAGG